MRQLSTAALSTAAMERVLPKESEREIQMRLEFEASKVRAAEAEKMFEGIGKGGGSKPGRRP